MENNGGCAQPQEWFLRLIRFSLQNGTFDFGTTIDYVNSTLTFYCCFYKYPFAEAGLTNVLIFHNTDNFCLAAFMLVPRNMHPARGVSLYKYPNSYDKVVSTGPNI